MDFYPQQSDHLCDKLMHQSVTEVTETFVRGRHARPSAQLRDTNADR